MGVSKTIVNVFATGQTCIHSNSNTDKAGLAFVNDASEAYRQR